MEVCLAIVNLKVGCSFRHQQLLLLNQSLVDSDDSDGTFEVPTSWLDDSWFRFTFGYHDLSRYRLYLPDSIWH